MASSLLFITSLLVGLVGCCYGSVLFSSLNRTLVVHASPKQGDVLRAGENKITVTWTLNQTLPASTDDHYTKVKLKLCYAPISQKDRAWRKTENEMKRDKTCQFTILAAPYYDSFGNADKSRQSFEWAIERDVPTATYFVRAYAYDSAGAEVAYGQTTDGNKASNLFDVQGISGRHVSLDIAAATFSAFSVLTLFGFFFNEKRKARAS
ncbi:hypothetical protein Scep_017951 [Stephania cephalantha]|uniref:High-affinity nitrate transporter n=1 Tax=Stephania cephalantha TaxID=152367 RepID=A0AAP0NUR3_9MAGN